MYELDPMLQRLTQKTQLLQEMYPMEQNPVDEDDHVIDNNKVSLQNKHDDDQKNILHFLHSKKAFVSLHHLVKYLDITLMWEDRFERDHH